jgi:hypothetical protein
MALMENGDALFVGIGDRLQGREVEVVGMLVGNPDVADLGEVWLVGGANQRPSIIEDFAGEPRVRQNAQVLGFNENAGMADEANFHISSDPPYSARVR